MTKPLEGIVRPFQTRDVSPAFVQPSNGAAPQSNTILAYGKNGSAKTFQTNFSSNATFYMDRQSDEQKRAARTKRISNPEDPSQYVDVEYIDSIDMLRKPDGQRTKYIYKNEEGDGHGGPFPAGES